MKMKESIQPRKGFRYFPFFHPFLSVTKTLERAAGLKKLLLTKIKGRGIIRVSVIVVSSFVDF